MDEGKMIVREALRALLDVCERTCAEAEGEAARRRDHVAAKQRDLAGAQANVGVEEHRLEEALRLTAESEAHLAAAARRREQVRAALRTAEE